MPDSIKVAIVFATLFFLIYVLLLRRLSRKHMSNFFEIGEFVFYTNHRGEQLPALVVGMNRRGYLDLQVFTNTASGSLLYTSVLPGEPGEPMHWSSDRLPDSSDS